MAVEIEKRLLGTDIEINATANKGGLPIDLDVLDGFIVYLYYNKSRYLQRYATSAALQALGWKVITITDGPMGKFQIKLQSVDTAGGKPGVLLSEFKTEDDDVTYDDDTIHEGTDDDVVVELVESLSKNDNELI